jgi:hypothetical protein
VSADYGSHTVADAEAFERHYGDHDGYSSGPDRYELAEFAAEMAAERAAAVRATQQRAAS